MSDPMHDMPQRRWEDVEHIVTAAVRQAMTPFQLTLNRLDSDVQQMKATVYGDAAYRRVGLVDRLDKIEGSIAAMGDKIDALIDASQARDNQFLGAKKAFYTLSVVIAVFGGPPAIVALLRAFGVSP